jgi:hypothetical protein
MSKGRLKQPTRGWTKDSCRSGKGWYRLVDSSIAQAGGHGAERDRQLVEALRPALLDQAAQFGLERDAADHALGRCQPVGRQPELGPGQGPVVIGFARHR